MATGMKNWVARSETSGRGFDSDSDGDGDYDGRGGRSCWNDRSDGVVRHKACTKVVGEDRKERNQGTWR